MGGWNGKETDEWKNEAIDLDPERRRTLCQSRVVSLIQLPLI